MYASSFLKQYDRMKAKETWGIRDGDINIWGKRNPLTQLVGM
jgi:hypothetical protein